MKEQKDILDYISPKRTSTPSPDYFEGLAQRVIAGEKTRIVPFYKKPVMWIGAAAAIAIGCVFLTSIFSPSPASSDPLLALQEVPSEEIMDYLHENIEDIDESEIEEAITEASLAIVPKKSIDADPTASTQAKESEITFDDINAEDILHYFNQEGIDPSELEEDDLF